MKTTEIKRGSTWKNRNLTENGPTTAPQLPNQFTVVDAQDVGLIGQYVSVVQVGSVNQCATMWPKIKFLSEFEPIET